MTETINMSHQMGYSGQVKPQKNRKEEGVGETTNQKRVLGVGKTPEAP